LLRFDAVKRAHLLTILHHPSLKEEATVFARIMIFFLSFLLFSLGKFLGVGILFGDSQQNLKTNP